jgi:hypothetical protein
MPGTPRSPSPRSKLRGAFALFRPQPGERSPWVLVKLEDEEADAETDVVALRPQAVRRVARRQHA